MILPINIMKLSYIWKFSNSKAKKALFTLNIAAWGSPSSWNGGLPVAISIMVQPRDQMSAGAPYPRGPLSIISGAMYCKVPGEDKKSTQVYILHSY